MINTPSIEKVIQENTFAQWITVNNPIPKFFDWFEPRWEYWFHDQHIETFIIGLCVIILICHFFGRRLK